MNDLLKVAHANGNHEALSDDKNILPAPNVSHLADRQEKSLQWTDALLKHSAAIRGKSTAILLFMTLSSPFSSSVVQRFCLRFL